MNFTVSAMASAQIKINDLGIGADVFRLKDSVKIIKEIKRVFV
jgi:hypothetical protein